MSNQEKIELIFAVVVILTIVWLVVPDNTDRYNEQVMSVTSNK